MVHEWSIRSKTELSSASFNSLLKVMIWFMKVAKYWPLLDGKCTIWWKLLSLILAMHANTNINILEKANNHEYILS